jgi:hypothetical protein
MPSIPSVIPGAYHDNCRSYSGHHQGLFVFCKIKVRYIEHVKVKMLLRWPCDMVYFFKGDKMVAQIEN